MRHANVPDLRQSQKKKTSGFDGRNSEMQLCEAFGRGRHEYQGLSDKYSKQAECMLRDS